MAITEGTVAETGTNDLKLVLQPEGGVKGKVAFADGSAPTHVHRRRSASRSSRSPAAASSCSTRCAPQKYELHRARPGVSDARRRGRSSSRARPPTSARSPCRRAARSPAWSSPTASRSPARPCSRAARSSATARATPRTSDRWGRARSRTRPTRAASSRSPASTPATSRSSPSIPTLGRSKAMRVPTDMPGQGELVLELQKFGSLSGVLRVRRQAGRGRVRELPIDDDAGRDLRRRVGTRRRLSLRPARARHVQGLGDGRHADDGHEVLLEGGRRCRRAKRSRSISRSSPAAIDGQRAAGREDRQARRRERDGSPPA